MKLSPGEQESIISLLTRIYLDIAAIETEYGLIAGNGDFRPRIEYFHDAVRALSSGDPKHREENGRLCVELLAYDLQCLRYLQEMPLSSFKPHAEPLSPATDLVAIDKSPVVKSKRPDRQLRERITDLYKHYAVLFAALLKPTADRDYHDRTDALNQDVAEIHSLMEELAGKASPEAVTGLAQHLEDGDIRQAVLDYLKHRKNNEKPALIQYLNEQSKAKDKTISAIDKAHMDYALAQLALYENSKDMLKKLAQQGTNLVGSFVESSIAETRREMGR